MLLPTIKILWRVCTSLAYESSSFSAPALFLVLSVQGPNLSVPEQCENRTRQTAVGGEGKQRDRSVC